MDKDSGLRLPLEIVLRVLESLAPPTAVALPSHDPAARCIRAFAITCRATYPVALRLLYSYCLYIDSASRLRQLLIALSIHSPTTINTSGYYAEDTDTSPSTTTITRPNTLPQVNVLPHLQSLYLSPFSRTSIDDLPTAHWIFELFSLTRHTLRRLVTSIPLGTLSPEQDHLNVRPRLRAAFEELTALEEFIAIDDDLHLSVPNPSSYHSITTATTTTEPIPVWAKWTTLRRLGLYGVDLVHPQNAQLRHLPHLTDIVLAHPEPNQRVGWNTFWTCLAQGTSSARATPVRVLYPMWDWDFRRPIQSRCGHHLDRIHWARIWNTEHHYGEKQGRVEFVAVAIDPRHSRAWSWDGVLGLKQWVGKRAVEGTLWDLERIVAVEGGGTDERRDGVKLTQSELDRDLWLDASMIEDSGDWN